MPLPWESWAPPSDAPPPEAGHHQGHHQGRGQGHNQGHSQGHHQGHNQGYGDGQGGYGGMGAAVAKDGYAADVVAAMTMGSTSSASLADLDWADVFLFAGEADDDGRAPVVPDWGAQPVSLDFQPDMMPHGLEAPPPPPPDEHLAMAEFFSKNGAWRPPEPCAHCRRLRLQCFILQTTAANPNPVHSCSSCVALFRQCSLAERSKRQPSHFETASPVIGRLHGVSEEQGDSWIQPPQAPDGPASSAPGAVVATSSKRASSRSVRKTQVLRDWFACNLAHPYPTDDEKALLAGQSGLSRTQVTNWFTNARRRHRLSTQSMVNNASFSAGSPLPRSLLSSMTPLERWRHSPPESEHVSESAIQQALSTSANKPRARAASDGSLVGLDRLGSPASSGSMLYAQSAYHYSSEASASSSYSHLSANSDAALSARSAEDGSRPAWAKPLATKVRRSKGRMFTCAHCSRTFSKKYDWLRHERCLHALGDVTWICAIPLQPNQSVVLWRFGHGESECIFCGHASPTEEHFQAHEFEACAKRTIPDRSFSRKDHLWQHLYKFHGCRKWEGWKPDLDLLQHKGAVPGSAPAAPGAAAAAAAAQDAAASC